MKTQYVKDVIRFCKRGESAELYGWIKSVRTQKYQCFIDMEDSTGMIRLIMDNTQQKFVPKPEQSVHCAGIMDVDSKGNPQIIVQQLNLIGDVDIMISPSARSDFDVFAPRNANNVVKNK